MLTGQDYRDSLKDDRRVFYDGELVDVTTHPSFTRSIASAAASYDQFYEFGSRRS